ncbi:MAG TPA: hypothetical protein VFD52_00405 [Clostridia bacterium]|nr:hypothetical protein [Clostridia bacterium]
MKKKTIIKTTVGIIAVCVMSACVISLFHRNTQASSPELTLPQSHDGALLILETRVSDMKSCVFYVMKTDKNTSMAFKTDETYLLENRPLPVWGLINYDFFVQTINGRTFCYVFNVSKWENATELTVEETEVGYNAYLIERDTGALKEYDSKNIPDGLLINAVKYSESLAVEESTSVDQSTTQTK